MKCHYYLARNLNMTSVIEDDLNAVGINNWYIHVVSKDEAGLKKERIHSGNFVEKSDALAGGLTGAMAGLVVGGLVALILVAAEPFGEMSGFVYAIIVLAPALFGLWEGMLLRAKYESKKMAPFHDEIQAGKYLFLIYTPKGKSNVVMKMMRDKHPEAEHIAVDTHFMDPLKSPRVCK